MATKLRLIDGFNIVDFLGNQGYSLDEGGMRLPSPKYRGTQAVPIVGIHGNTYKEIEYRNRKVQISFTIEDTTYSGILDKINKINTLVNEANMGQEVAVEYEMEDSPTGYLKVLAGTFEFPGNIMSRAGIGWKEGNVFKLHDCTLELETSPFFSDTFEGERFSAVPYSKSKTISNDDGDLNLTSLPGDVLSDTILKFTGNYSDGLGYIWMGMGKHALETTLDGTINSTQTTITPQNGFVNDLLVPFEIQIDTENMRVTELGSSWTVERGYGGTTAASHTDGSTVSIISQYYFDADDSLSYCTTSVLTTGTVTDVAINAAGSGYSVNKIITISSGNSDATLRVLDVDGSGAVQEVEIVDGGTGYTTGTGFATTDSGSGLTIDINGVSSDTATVTASTTDDLNSNYMEISMAGQGIRQLVKWTVDRKEVAVINQKARIMGRLAQTASGWTNSVDYRIKLQYDSDSGYSNELTTTAWRAIDDSSSSILDLGLVNFPPTATRRSAADIQMILEARIKPEQVYDASLTLQTYTIRLDFLRIMPVGNGLRYIKCSDVPVETSDRLLDDSRRSVPIVEEFVGSEFDGEVTVTGLMSPLRTNPLRNGNSLHIIFQSKGYSSSLTQSISFDAYVIGNYIGMAK